MNLSRAAFLKLLGITAAAGSATAVAACTTGSKDSATESNTLNPSAPPAQEGAFPVTLTNAFGETTIETEPTRIACVGWINGDITAALGIIPVAQAKITWGQNDNDSNDWFDARVEELGAQQPTRYDEADGINTNAIADANPDLIINVVGNMDQEQYDKLSKIAPVVTFEKGGENWTTSWDKATEIIGKALGRSDEAKAVVTRIKEKMSAVGDTHPEILGATFIASYLDPSGEEPISLYAPADVRSQFFYGIGMVPAPVLDQAGFNEGTFYTTWSAERASELDSDFLYTWVNTEEDIAAINESPLLNTIPAVADGGMLASADKKESLALGTSPLGMEWLLTDSTFIDQVAAATAQGRAQ